MPKRESETSITINNQKIIKFFNDHQNLDIEQTFLAFIDIMEKLKDTLNNSINTGTISNLFETIKSMQSKIDSMDQNLNKFQSDTVTNFSLKMNEFKTAYIEDLRLILTQNVADKIEPLIKEQNTLLYDKTTGVINTLIPKSNRELAVALNKSIETVNKSIASDTQKLLTSNITTKSLNEFINNIETKLNASINHNQTILNTSLTATEQRLDTRISEVKTCTENELKNINQISQNNSSTSQNLNNSLTDLLKKMENSSSKGKISENLVVDILHSLYPSAQIDSVGQQKETGDIMLTRTNKPKILVENKVWNKNVVQEEIKKFIHDIETQNCCGVFLSQNYGVAGKENYEINIHDGKVLVYVHEVNNDPEKIKIAIDIIDHFKDRLDDLDDDSEIDTINKEKLEAINSEYQAFAHSKLSLIKLAKEFNQKFLKQIEEIKIPTLEEYLSTKYASSSSKITCEYCGFVAKNHQAKSAHLRGCQVKKAQMSGNQVINIVT